MAVRQCEGLNCKIEFEPATWNQKYHDTICKRISENLSRRKEFTDSLQEALASEDKDHKALGNKPRILLLDIETSPNLVYTWGLFNQNIGLNQIEETSRMICFSAKWLGDSKKNIIFHSIQDGTDIMVKSAWDLLDQADAVIHYNGISFDIPHMNREFLEASLGPPSPYQNIDLYRVIKRFKFQSRKLAHVSKKLGFEGKIQHEGFDLWRKCMQGDVKAWESMKKYNMRDVTLLEDMHGELLPWIPNLPNQRLYNADAGCPRCGSTHVQRRGISRSATSIFQQFQCQECHGWFRETHRSVGVDCRDV